MSGIACDEADVDGCLLGVDASRAIATGDSVCASRVLPAAPASLTSYGKLLESTLSRNVARAAAYA